MDESFSDRHGYKSEDVEISVREDAPAELRYAIPLIAQATGMSPSAMRRADCPWHKVYDTVEALYAEASSGYPDHSQAFAERLNQFFREKGIGWQIQDGKITFRGSEVFQESTREAILTLTHTGRESAANEIHEALRDISRRPEPDITGAIQHAVAALESTARDVLRQPNRTLGQLIRDLQLPKPLDAAVEKLWGYASDRARHVREGQEIQVAEAELLVSVSCAVCTFLSRNVLQ
jgi:hypothetical protein